MSVSDTPARHPRAQRAPNTQHRERSELTFTFSNLPAVGWGLSARAIADLAARAEAVGFDRFAVADLTFHYDVVPVMTACLLATKQIQVESLVTNPYTRNVAILAATWATMADLSGGRAIFGIGSGGESGRGPWIQPWGKERPGPLSAVRDAVGVVRRLWAGERVTFRGSIVQLEDVQLDCPLPPHIPVLIAARGPQMLRVAAGLADVVHLASLVLNVDHQRANIAAVQAGATAAGRSPADFEIDLSVTVSVDEDGEVARHEAERNAAQTIAWTVQGWRDHNLGALPFDVPEALIDGLMTGWREREVTVPPNLSALMTDHVLDQFALAGTPEECADRLIALVDQLPGVTGVRIKFPRPVRSATFADYAKTVDNLGAVISAVRAKSRAAAGVGSTKHAESDTVKHAEPSTRSTLPVR